MFDSFFPAEWSTLKKLLVLAAILKTQKKHEDADGKRAAAEDTEVENGDS